MIDFGLTALLWIAGAVLLFALGSVLTLRSYSRFARRARGPVSMALPKDGPATPLDALLAPHTSAHPGASGLKLLLDNTDAFACRLLSAAQAGRSLDLMYYIWRTDLSGWILLAELMAAADRGVRVRLLLDDVNVQGFDPAFLALNQHPLIEVRLFNPTRNRGHPVRRTFEMLLGLTRFNRRMHGKLWIADGRLAILGGRNIGDLYLGARDSGKPISVDADVMLVGPRVAEVEAAFDGYWNLGLSLPILVLWPHFKMNMAAFRRRLARHGASAAARRFRAKALAGRSPETSLALPLHWTDKVQLLADPPDKAYGQRSAPWMTETISALLAEARHDVRLITPYFVPGAAGLASLTDLAARGVRVSLLTNALSATDMVVVHGAYRHYRRPLLKAGMAIREFAPLPGRNGKRAMLHSKVFIIDGQRAVVGSLNFDLRSANINTELGLLFEQPELVAELMRMHDQLGAPDQSYHLALKDGKPLWSATRPGLPAVVRFEPEAARLLRAISWIVGHLPIQRYL
ncbi:MAG TPA: phospholipase D family protein [Paracoccaceae bacterium]